MPSNIHVVVGGQYGSEAKGHVAAQLSALLPKNSVAIRVAGPNAGHSVVDQDGEKWALRQLPVAAVANPDCQLVIAPGSEIDPVVLDQEIRALDPKFNVKDRLHIDMAATVIEHHHREMEADDALVERVGSTGKGIGAARAHRIMRQAQTWDTWGAGPISDTGYLWRSALETGGSVLIEGTQGYGLGLHTGFYPHTTSSDCTAVDFLSMAGISPWYGDQMHKLHVWPVFRTYPIRVAGNSGPMYKEITWEDLHERTGGYIQPEFTTVTGKMRRVGEWDSELAWAAMQANGAPSANLHPILSFFDYWVPEVAGMTDWHKIQDRNPELFDSLIEPIENDLGQALDAVCTGPDSIAWEPDLHDLHKYL